MKAMNQGNIRYSAIAFVAMCATLLVASVLAYAKSPDQPSETRSVRVVSHLAVPGTPASEMALQKENGREYLYLVRNSGRGFTVVDVTRPDDPNLVKKVDLPAGRTVNFEMLGTTMGLAEESNRASHPASQPESVQLFDLSDPANPRSVRTFNGVTSVLAEDGRNLVYIANSNGLWILRRPTKPTTRPCTSSDQISGMPECY